MSCPSSKRNVGHRRDRWHVLADNIYTQPRAEESIKQKVDVAHDMSVGIQKFENDSLSDKEVATIAKWVVAARPRAIPPTCRGGGALEDSASAKPRDLVVSMGKEHQMYTRGF